MDIDADDGSAGLAAFSTWLARERELRGLSRDEVLRATRLAPAVVEALEAGEPSRLPPRAYVVGYLRAYAGAVGLDADEVVLRYEEAAGADAAGAGRRRRRVAPWVAGAILALAAAGGAIWAWLRW
jgi:cytoskeletal protein RodZ